VSCWGLGESGQLGNGATQSSARPVPVSGLSDARAIASGAAHTCALRASGEVVCWGSDSSRQLGRGDAGGRSETPVTVQGIAGATAIDAGGSHSCAVVGGGVRCWGSNGYGQLGDGREEGNSGVPVEVPGLTDVSALALGLHRSCAIASSGQVQCWGYNNYTAQLLGVGVSDVRNVVRPAPVTGLGDAAALSIGDNHACAVRRGGQLSCWGNGLRMGDGQTTAAHEPRVIANAIELMTAEASVPATFAPTAGVEVAVRPHVASGSHHVCGVLADGRVRCFGPNVDGQLGIGSTEAVPASNERTVPGLTDVTQVAAYGSRTCARRANGRVACWGTLGTFDATSLPIAIDGVEDAAEVAVGGDMTCARHATGAVSCWGQNNAGQLGNGTRNASTTPVPVSELTDATALALGSSTACAIRASGAVSCWGSGSYGQLGNGATDSSTTPVAVTGLAGATAIAAGGSFFCAAHRQGRVSCWGSNRKGQIGDGRSGDEGNATAPVEVAGLRDVVSVGAGLDTVCALRRNGTGVCWGASSFGQTGHGEAVDIVPRPQAVMATDPTVQTFAPPVQVVGGWNYMCALHRDGHVSCAGSTPLGGSGGFFGLANVRSANPVPAPDLVFPATEG
jgi:alpha-tubulin suppressor-like RCC1 family protein